MWFGTKDYSTYIPTPVSGADVSPEGWGDSGTTLNGSGFVMNSFNSHKTYDFSWRQTTARETAQLIKSFYDGSFGRGKIYLVDPLTTSTNVLPARWADPSITIDFEGPQLVPGVDPRPVITSGFEKNKLPVTSALFNLNGIRPVTGLNFEVEATNFFQNPRFTGSGQWAEVYRNQVIQPILSQRSTQWDLSGGLSTQPTSTGLRFTVASEIPLETHLFMALSAGGFSAPGGTTVKSSVRVSVPGEALGSVSVQGSLHVSLAGGGVETPRGPETVITPGTEATVEVTYVVPSGGADLVRVSISQGEAFQAGDIFDILDGWDARVGTNPVTNGFNGNTPARSVDPDMRQRWTGEVNNSASVMEIERVTGLTGTRCIAGVSTRSGEPAVRLIATQFYSGNSADLQSYASFTIPFALSVGGGVALGTRSQNEPIAPPLSQTFMTLGFSTSEGYDPAPVFNAPGSFEYRVPFSFMSVGSQVRFGHGGAQGAPDVWWTDIAIINSGYTGPAFSGSSAIPGKSTRWSGAVDSSSSQIGVEVVTSQPNLNDDNAVYIPIPDNMQLNIGAFYEASSEDVGVWVSPVINRGVVASEVQRLTPVETSSDTLFPDVFTKEPGVVGVYIWIGKISSANANVAIRGIHARLSPVGKPPAGPRHWMGGQGNGGVRFIGPPSYVNHTGVNGGQVECAASFKESLF